MSITHFILPLLRLGAATQAKKRVERAETDGAGEDKDYGQGHQHDAQRTRNHIGKIKRSDDGRDYRPDNPVCCSHIFCHNCCG